MIKMEICSVARWRREVIATAMIFAPNLRHSGCETRSLSGCWCIMRADRGYNEGVSRVKYQ